MNPCSASLMVHADDQQFDFRPVGRGGVVEEFGDVFDLLVGEFEADHFETARMPKPPGNHHSSFSQILMRGSILRKRPPKVRKLPQVAERVGFEPTVGLTLRTISSRVP